MPAIRNIFVWCLLSITVLAIPVPVENEGRSLQKRPQVVNTQDIPREAIESVNPILERGTNDIDTRSLVKRPQVINTKDLSVVPEVDVSARDSPPIIERAVKGKDTRTLEKRPKIIISPVKPGGRSLRKRPQVVNIENLRSVPDVDVSDRVAGKAATYNTARSLVKRPQVINAKDLWVVPEVVSSRDASPISVRGTNDKDPRKLEKRLNDPKNMAITPGDEVSDHVAGKVATYNTERSLVKRPQVINAKDLWVVPDVDVSRRDSHSIIERGTNDKDARTLEKRSKVIVPPNFRRGNNLRKRPQVINAQNLSIAPEVDVSHREDKDTRDLVKRPQVVNHPNEGLCDKCS